MKKYGVFKGRVLVVDYRTKKEAVYPTLRKAMEYSQMMNSHGAGYYPSEIITGKRIIKI